MRRSFWTLFLALALIGVGCDDETEGDGDGDGDADSDTDGDGDGDSDGDGDGDGDGDSEIRWISIPGGTFEMGCSEGDDDCDDSELPDHTVTVAAFELAATETTQAQWTALRDYNPSRFLDCGSSCPIETVTWVEAREFCEELGARLPTEAEWEYAARAGTTSIFGCGDDESCLEGTTWYVANADLTTHPVAQLEPNAFGLYDLQGNVWEWIEDCWHDDYTDAPVDSSAWDADPCEYVVARGGSWGLDARGMRLSARNGDYPNSYLLPAPGFRCAR